MLAHVTFPGAVTKDTVPGYLQEADIFVDTTNVDNTPVSVSRRWHQAFVSLAQMLADFLLTDHGHNTLLVPPNHPASMAAASRQVLAEPRLAKELTLNTRKKVESFDWSEVLPEWSSLFDRLRKGSRVSLTLLDCYNRLPTWVLRRRRRQEVLLVLVAFR